jgi:hypothetical protein
MRKSGTVTPWYLSGGVALADVLGAWHALGRADFAESIIDLSGKNTQIIAANITGYTANYPAAKWNTATGWEFDLSLNFLRILINTSNIKTVVLRVKRTNTGNYPLFLGARNSSGTERLQLSHTMTLDSGRINNIATYNGTLSSGIFSNNNFVDTNLHIITRTQTHLYQDGNLINSIASPVGTPPAFSLVLGNQALSDTTVGTSGTQLVGFITGLALYSVNLTPEQVLAISTAMALL